MTGLGRLGLSKTHRVTAGDAPAPDADRAPGLQTPDSVRQGEVPKRRGGLARGLLRGAVLTGVAAAIFATALPVREGAALTEGVPGVTDEAKIVQTERPIRGVLHTDLAGARMEPLTGQGPFTINGESVDRLWIRTLGDVGEPRTVLGDIDLSSATAYSRVETETGAEGTVWLPETLSLADATTEGLPRDVSGVVRRGAAPGAEPGADADHLFLHLPEGAAVFLNGAVFRDAVHLGAEADHPGLQPGAAVALGARLAAQDTPDGPMARLASVVSLAVHGLEGAPSTPPTFEGGGFVGADGTPSPTLTLRDQAGEQDLVVLDPAGGRAYRGAVTEGGQAFKGFYEDYALTTHLAGGPEISLKEGAPLFEGRPLEPVGPVTEDAGTRSGWFHDAESGVVLHLEIAADAARTTQSFTAP